MRALWVVLLALSLPRSAEALPIEGLEAFDWNMSRAKAVRLVGKRIDARWTTTRMVAATVPIRGAARWVELHFDDAGLASVYVALGPDAGLDQFLAKFVAEPRVTNQRPTWVDATTRLTLDVAAGCHSAHVGLWLRRRRPRNGLRSDP